MNPNYKTIGESFVKFYYEVFDCNRQQLKALYRADSMLSFEGQDFQGADRIIEKIQSLPFTKLQHVITTVDCQPSSAFGVFVQVVGQLKTDEDHPHSFSQSFILKPTDEQLSNYYVLNDAFRLALHNH